MLCYVMLCTGGVTIPYYYVAQAVLMPDDGPEPVLVDDNCVFNHTCQRLAVGNKQSVSHLLILPDVTHL